MTAPRILLSGESAVIGRLRAATDAMLSQPMAVVVSVSIGRGPDEPTYARIEAGGETILLHEVRGWPLHDLSPLGVAHTIAGLCEGATPGGDDGAREAVEPFVSAALLVAHLDDALPEGLDAEGVFDVEFCMDAAGRPILYLDPDGACHRIDPDPVLLERVLGPIPVPCHVFEWQDDDSTRLEVGISASDEEGFRMDVRLPDTVESLRLAAAIAETEEQPA